MSFVARFLRASLARLHSLCGWIGYRFGFRAAARRHYERVLVLRGADSDLLTKETAEEMKHRGPGATVVEFAGCGHAPALMEATQVAVVRDWLVGEVR